MKKSVILLIILFLLSLITSNLVRAQDYTGVPVPQQLGIRTTVPDKTVNVNPYKDNNEKLYSVVGKTQLIKFDEPVKRISITDPATADLVLLSPKELLLNGKKAGRTSLLFWGNGDKPVFFNLVVQPDTDAVIQAIEQVAPNENISYSFTDDGLILSGHISSSTVKKNIEDVVKAYNIKLVNLTESPTKQVLLEVKITEASRNFTRQLASRFISGKEHSAFIKDMFDLISSTGTYPDLNTSMFNGSVGRYLFNSNSAELAWVIEAAETKGILKILAEPKLLAIDGKQGSFNVGQEIPYPSSIGMSATASYSFKNTGVILNFTPTILEKSNRVILELSPEVSEIDESYKSGVAGVPGFKTRRVDTTVELADGETLIIAGLLSHTSSVSDTIIPGLGDLPIIGPLFSNSSKTKRDTELVIFITPKIVEVDQNKSRMEL